MRKPVINMMSSASKVKGQGVGSAYIEQLKLVREGLSDKFHVCENAKSTSKAAITHYHTVDLPFYFSRRKAAKTGATLGYVHLLPETVENSLDLPRFMKRVFYWYLIKFYKSMDLLVTVNPYFIGELERYGVKKDKVCYIPNFVSTDEFFPLSKEEKIEIRKKYGICKEQFVVLSVGQLQKRKGIFDFLELARRMPDISFVWAGGFSFGSVTHGYKKLSSVLENPPANVRFLGILDRDKMNGVYNMADMLLLASFEELFPMTILEAMCINLPILLRELNIYENILFDFYYRGRDVGDFVTLITRLRNDRDYYNQGVLMSKRGNEYYSKHKIIKQWSELYSRLLNIIHEKSEKTSKPVKPTKTIKPR